MSSAATQSSLALAIHQRTVLVPVPVVRAALGVDADTVSAYVESGTIRWAWDIAARRNGIRELRIWARELIQPASRAMQPEEVIDLIVGTRREHLRAVEVAQLLICSRPHVKLLHELGELQGPLAGHTQHITRSSLHDFFVRRLVGASVS